MNAAAAEPARAPASAACPASAAEKQGQEADHDDPLLLLKLDDAALARVVSLLDGWRSRARLRSACRRLRAAANGAVTELQAYAHDSGSDGSSGDDDDDDGGIMRQPRRRRGGGGGGPNWRAFPALRALSLDDPDALPGGSTAAGAATMKQLTRLRLDGDHGAGSLAAVAERCPQLRALSLRGGSWNDAGAASPAPSTAPRRFPHLTALDFSHVEGASEAAVLLALDGATWPLFPAPPPSPSTTFESLLTLRLDGCRLGPGLPHVLERLPSLASLSLHSALGVGASAAQLAALPAAAPALTRLAVDYTRANDAAVAALAAGLPLLAALSLKGTNAGDDALESLAARAACLTELHVKHCHRVTEEGLAALGADGSATRTSLQVLSVGYTSWPEADDVAALLATALPRLCSLDLLAARLTDGGLSALSVLGRLTALGLWQAGVSAGGLTRLCSGGGGDATNSPTLRALTLYGTHRVREFSTIAAGLPRLESLTLGGLELSAAPGTLGALSGLGATLTRLSLERARPVPEDELHELLLVDGGGGVNGGLPRLRQLRLRELPGVSRQAAERLDAAAGAAAARVLWAAAASESTDDEDDGWLDVASGQMWRPSC